MNDELDKQAREVWRHVVVRHLPPHGLDGAAISTEA